MSAADHFQRPERAPYELSYLLRALPRNLVGSELTAEQRDQVQAAGQHASIVTSTMLHGLESMGRVMWSAGVNLKSPPDLDDFANVGQLVTGLAVQLQFLVEFQSEAEECARQAPRKGGAR